MTNNEEFSDFSINNLFVFDPLNLDNKYITDLIDPTFTDLSLNRISTDLSLDHRSTDLSLDHRSTDLSLDHRSTDLSLDHRSTDLSLDHRSTSKNTNYSDSDLWNLGFATGKMIALEDLTNCVFSVIYEDKLLIEYLNNSPEKYRQGFLNGYNVTFIS